MGKYVFSEHGVGYKIGKRLQPWRPQFETIVQWIENGSKVLDVGCGDGVLGARLIIEKHCRVWGFDLDETGVDESIRLGIKAQVYDMDNRWPFGDQTFDFVVASDVLQCSKLPDLVVTECLRVGKEVIIEFPNFGFWFYRVSFLALGRFPKLSLYGHRWWETLQIKFFSFRDFLSLPALSKAKVEMVECIDWRNRKISKIARFDPNFLGRSCIVKIKNDL